MPGTKAGTGYRIRARCLRCSRKDRTQRRGYAIAPTGNCRPHGEARRSSTNIRSDPDFEFEYHCPDCGFIGWTKHGDVARKARLGPHAAQIARQQRDKVHPDV